MFRSAEKNKNDSGSTQNRKVEKRKKVEGAIGREIRNMAFPQ